MDDPDKFPAWRSGQTRANSPPLAYAGLAGGLSGAAETNKGDVLEKVSQRDSGLLPTPRPEAVAAVPLTAGDAAVDTATLAELDEPDARRALDGAAEWAGSAAVDTGLAHSLRRLGGSRRWEVTVAVGLRLADRESGKHGDLLLNAGL